MSWISIDDKMPDQEDLDVTENVLLYLTSDMIVSGFYSRDDQEWHDFNGDLVDYIYYWQPLPEPPK
ncbi:hypothetical protein D3C77_532600 [compost metagenome]